MGEVENGTGKGVLAPKEGDLDRDDPLVPQDCIANFGNTAPALLTHEDNTWRKKLP